MILKCFLFFMISIILNCNCEIDFYTSDQLPCLEYARNLSVISSNFINCALTNARPLTICSNCLEYYLEFEQTYKLMSGDNTIYASSLYKNGLTCKNIIEAADKVQHNYQIFSVIRNIWSQANCDSCFESYSIVNGTIDYDYSEKIKKFNILHKNLLNCIYNVTGNIIPLDPIFDFYAANSTLCIDCKNDYVEFTNHFISMGDENEICMDTVDTANYTRVIWSKGYQCSYRDPDAINCLVIVTAFTLLTSSFYILMKIFGRKEPKKKATIFRRKIMMLGNQITA